MQNSSSVPVVRTALFNLVVYTCSTDEADQAAMDVAEIVSAKPCRAIIADVTPALPDDALGSVSVVCGVTSRGDRRLCGDMIYVRIDNVALTVGSVLPLLAPDVPVFLWIPGPICGDMASVDRLAEATDGIISDSRRFDDSQRFQGIEWLMQHVAGEQAVHDLGWMAIRSLAGADRTFRCTRHKVLSGQAHLSGCILRRLS